MAGATTMERGTERMLRAFGVTKTVEEWSMDARAAVYGELILRRLDEGMAPEQAIALPLPKAERGPVKVMAWGERKTVRDWADDYRCAVSIDCLRSRLALDWNPEEAITRPAQTRMNSRLDELIEAWGEIKALRDWEMDERATSDARGILLRLDRKESPEWAIGGYVTTRAKQRKFGSVTAWGETKSVFEWATDRRAGTSEGTIRHRLKAGWEAEQAIGTPTMKGDLLQVTAFGESKDLMAWTLDARCKVGAATLNSRLKAGMAPEEAISSPARRRPGATVTAWGETKHVREWAEDARATVKASSILMRLAKGMSPEVAIGGENAIPKRYLVHAFGEAKGIAAWARDPRCAVCALTLMKRLHEGMEPERAITTKKIVVRPAKVAKNARLITAWGETKVLHKWTHDARCVVEHTTVRHRLEQGWSPEEAISTPSSLKPLSVMAWGETKTFTEWLEDPRCRVGAPCLYQRLKKGTEPEEAMTKPSAEGWIDRPMEAFGETRTLKEWSEDSRCGVSYTTLLSRITNYGYGLELALSAPTVGCKRGRYGEFVEAFGERKLLGEWMADTRCVVSRKALGRRLRLGWELEKAMVTPERGDLAVNVQGKFVEAFGERKNVRQWSLDARCAVEEGVLAQRLIRGWEPERAISTPPLAAGEVTVVREPRGAELRVTAWGETRRIGAWAKDPRCMVRTALLRHRIDHGWSPEEALATPAGGGRDEREARATAWAQAVERDGARALAVAFGEAKTVADWAADPRARAWGEAIAERLAQGVPPEEAITCPANAATRSAPRVLAWGERKTIVDWSDDARAAVSTGLIRSRIEGGWEPERAISTPAAEPSPRLLEAFGETKHLQAWAEDERTVVCMWTIRKRLAEGWSPEAALATPGREQREGGLTAWGETKTLAAWALDPRCEVSAENLSARLKRGLTPEEAISRRSHLVRHGENAPDGGTRLEAWGDAKALNEWLADPRCVVGAATLRNRIADGVAPEVALASPDASPWKDGVTAWGETKSIAAWARDPRCTVNPGQVAVRLGKGMAPEEAIGGENRYAGRGNAGEDRPKGVPGFATLVTAYGETKTPQAWSRDARCMVSSETIRVRLEKGMDAEAAISAPREAPEVMVTAWGETKGFAEWLRDARCVVTQNGLRERLRRGMEPEEALTQPVARRGENNLVEAFGERKTMQAWAADPRCRVTYPALQRRLLKGTMGAEEAITRPGVERDRHKNDSLATAFGETKTLAEWIKDPRSPVSRGALTMRIERGWPLEDALTLPEGAIHPLKDHRRMLTAWGETKTLKDWGRDPRCVVAENTIAYRIDRGWPLEQALTHPQMTNAVGRGSKRRGLSKPHARRLGTRAA